MKKVYLLSSLRNPRVPLVGNSLRELGFEVFDHWWGGGPEADEWWQRYEVIRGRSYPEALDDHYVQHIFSYDLEHLDSSDIGVLILPCGRSGHLELGYLRGQGKPCYVLFDGEPDRWDIMYRLATKVFFDEAHLINELKERWLP